MKKEEIICKNCKKPIDIEDEIIFEGYCKKCYCKCVRDKELKHKLNKEEEKPTLVLYELSILCYTIATGIFVVVMSLIIPFSFLIMFGLSDNIFKGLFVSNICFSLCGIILGLISIEKYKDKEIKSKGLIISIIELIIVIFLYLNMFN